MLKKFSNHLQIENVSDGYKLQMQDISIDIVAWENKLKAAPPLHIETIKTYEEIMELYTEPYLKHYNFYWAESEQFRLEQVWTETAMKMAELYEVYHLYEDAVKWYDKICITQPEDEDACFALMKIYAKLDYGILVNHLYVQLEKALKEIDIEMSPEIRNWYQQWRIK